MSQQSKNINDILSHLANHMEEIAKFAIPRGRNGSESLKSSETSGYSYSLRDQVSVSGWSSQSSRRELRSSGNSKNSSQIDQVSVSGLSRQPSRRKSRSGGNSKDSRMVQHYGAEDLLRRGDLGQEYGDLINASGSDSSSMIMRREVA